MDNTKKMLISMLKENTGSSMCDSGSAYGRNWERNQTRKFKKEPEGTLDVSAFITKEGEHRVELGVTLSTFHFLSEALEYASHEDRALQAFARRAENKDSNWLQLAEDFAEHYWPNETGSTINTYNGESNLDQTLQYVEVGENEGFIVLSIHQGCDVRGGYGKPRVFRFNNDWDKTLWNIARGSIYCENGHGWSIEPGYSQGFSDESNLDAFPQYVLGDDEKPVAGKLCARDNKGKRDEAYCPICTAKLSAGS